MKKLLILAAFIISMTVFDPSVNAEKKQHKHDSVGMEQVFDHFMLSQFNDQIRKALEDFYETESITFQYNWFEESYDVVEMLQTEKGRELSHPFIVKFTVVTYSEKEKLGTDTITFGVSSLVNKKLKDDLVAVKSEQIKFDHNEPKKKG